MKKYRPTQRPDESMDQPKLILSPSDLLRITNSDLDTADFANEQYREIAQLLEKLSILEHTAEGKLNTWERDPETSKNVCNEAEEERHRVRGRLHDIFLSQHSYPSGHQMKLMPSDAYEQLNAHSELSFRNVEMQNLAQNIGMIASFERELESYLTEQDGDLEEGERKAMIRNTLACLEQTKDHLVKILTGYYDKQRH